VRPGPFFLIPLDLGANRQLGKVSAEASRDPGGLSPKYLPATSRALGGFALLPNLGALGGATFPKTCRAPKGVGQVPLFLGKTQKRLRLGDETVSRRDS